MFWTGTRSLKITPPGQLTVSFCLRPTAVQLQLKMSLTSTPSTSRHAQVTPYKVWSLSFKTGKGRLHLSVIAESSQLCVSLNGSLMLKALAVSEAGTRIQRRQPTWWPVCSTILLFLLQDETLQTTLRMNPHQPNLCPRDWWMHLGCGSFGFKYLQADKNMELQLFVGQLNALALRLFCKWSLPLSSSVAVFSQRVSHTGSDACH